MSSIDKYIEGYMSGDAWEDLCVKCYRLRYQSDNYTSIPAIHHGDAGIEGYTNKGIVHQCYCPERSYSDEELYTHLRDKLTQDTKKLVENASKLTSLGVPIVKEWHFNIPEYRDARILQHAETKRQEILNDKKNNLAGYAHIDSDFQIVIKTAEDFKPEISRLIRTNITDMKLNLAITHEPNLDWSKCESQKVDNIRRKIKAVMQVDDRNEALNKVVNLYIDNYISGIEIMQDLRVNFPEIYDSIYRLEQSYKRDVEIRTNMNTDNKMNKSLFDNILEDFHSKLEQDFSKQLTEASIGELKHDLVASWLADCSMEFRNE